MKHKYLLLSMALFVFLILFSTPSFALIPGDFGSANNGPPDGCVDFEDLMIFALAYGSCSGDLIWNPICDIASSGGSLTPDGCIDFEDLMIFAMHYGECDDPSDSGNKVFLESGGTLNGTSINPSDPTLTVNSGESITGTLKVQAIYSGPSGNVVPFGYTPSWGSHSSSYVTVISDLPVGTSPYDVSINLNAPTTPGTYYLIFASNCEMNLGWTMSQTNWTTGTMSWDDGDDIADLTEPELQDSLSTGFLYLDMLTGSTYNKSNYGIAYVKINVGTISDYDFYNIYHEAELEGDYVVRDGYKIKVITVYSDGRVTYEINDSVNVTLDPGQFYDGYDGGKLVIYHEFGDTDVNKVASWQTWTVNLDQKTITPDNLQVTQGQQDAYYIIHTPGNTPYNIRPAKVTSDGEYIANNWDDSWSISTIDSTHYKALIDIPANAPIKTYNFWLKYMHSGTGDWFAQKVQLTVNPYIQTRIINLSGDLNFGTVQVGSTSTRTLRISNTGNSTLHVNGISYPPGFSGNWSGDIPAGSYHDVTVTFAPTQVKIYDGPLTVSSNATSGINTKLVYGTGGTITRIIRLEGDLNFDSVQVGSTSQKTLTIYNDGNSTLTVTNIDYPTGFSGDWSGDIPAGSYHDVTVTFTPTQVKIYDGTLTVSSNKTSGANTKSVSGNGTEIPTVTTQAVTNIETNSVTANGTITSDGGSNITEKGFEYGLTQTPTWSVKETGTDLGTGAFSNTISGLNSDTTYWVKAYAVNNDGKSVNEDWQEFRTKPDNIIITNSATFTCDGQQAVMSDCSVTVSF